MPPKPHCVALWLRDRKKQGRVGKPCRRKATWRTFFSGVAIETCRHHRIMVCADLRAHSVEYKFERIKKSKAAKAAERKLKCPANTATE